MGEGEGDFTDVVAQFPDIADDEKLKRKILTSFPVTLPAAVPNSSYNIV